MHAQQHHQQHDFRVCVCVCLCGSHKREFFHAKGTNDSNNKCLKRSAKKKKLGYIFSPWKQRLATSWPPRARVRGERCLAWQPRSTPAFITREIGEHACTERERVRHTTNKQNKQNNQTNEQTNKHTTNKQTNKQLEIQHMNTRDTKLNRSAGEHATAAACCCMAIKHTTVHAPRKKERNLKMNE